MHFLVIIINALSFMWVAINGTACSSSFIPTSKVIRSCRYGQISLKTSYLSIIYSDCRLGSSILIPLYNIWPHFSIRTPAPEVMKFTILVDSSFVMPQYRQEKEKKCYIFIIWPCPSTTLRIPAPGVMKIFVNFLSWNLKILVDSFCHHNFILSLSDLCLGVKKILKEKYIFTICHIWPRPSIKNPWPRGHGIYNFVKLLYSYHLYIHVLSMFDLWLEVEKKVRKK